MPAARHFSWSRFMAWAVSAMMGWCLPVAIFFLAHDARCLEAVHFGHLHVHEHQVEHIRFERFDGLAAVVGDGHAVASFFEQAGGEPLVHNVVLGDQNVQDFRGVALVLERIPGDERNRARLHLRAKHASDGLAQFRLPNGLEQVGGNTQRFASLRVAAVARQR